MDVQSPIAPDAPADLGVASYLAFTLLVWTWFSRISEGSWQELVLLGLSYTAVVCAPFVFILLAVSALWQPRRRRLVAACAILATIFCATSVPTLLYWVNYS